MPAFPGFSKLTPGEKIQLLLDSGSLDEAAAEILLRFTHTDPGIRSLVEQMTENVITSFHLPFSVIPNVTINGKTGFVPMVIEESSVVAAAAWSSKFWSGQGGFRCRVISDIKIGQIHFIWRGDPGELRPLFPQIFGLLKEETRHLTRNMEQRGGGISGFEWIDFSDRLPGFFQIRVSFRTADSMGANFINSCLEEMSQVLNSFIFKQFGSDAPYEPVMSILSNYTPDCLVECSVSCKTEAFADIRGAASGTDFARRFKTAVDIAILDPYRAVTHNKGIFNGIDAVVLATANDFRAVEACGHAWAARSGSYSSLTLAEISDDTFDYMLTLPLALGTVGGLTSTHPLARIALQIMNNPSATELMQIAAAVGMANNFSAIKALITSGIQEGHMRMHLPKILEQLHATEAESASVREHFRDKTVGYRAVADFIEQIRKKDQPS